MLINTDYATPQELSGYARGALADLEQNQFTLSQWLPSVTVDDLVYRFTRGGEGLADAATFRAYDAESTIGKRPGITRVSGELPPVSRKIRLGEYDRLRQRNLDSGITDALYSDAERMAMAVAARIEVARGQALVTGTVAISENGFIAAVDYGRSGGHTNVAPGVLWSTPATATPIADLLTWVDTYVATNNGLRPGAILMPTAVRSAMLRTAEVRGYAAANGVSPSIVTPAVLAQILSAFDLPQIYLNDTQVNVNGSATRVIAAKNVVMLPAPGQSQLGGTFWGTTAESLTSDYSGVGEGIVAGAYDTKDPVAMWTKAAGIALPVLANPNLSFNAVVLA